MNIDALQRSFNLAEQAFAAGRLKEAERLLCQLRPALPGSAPVLHLSALTAKRDGRSADALRWFELAAQAAPDDPAIHANRGNLFTDIDDYAAALNSYDNALGIRPGFAPALLGKATVLQRLNKHEQALDCLSKLENIASAAAQVFTMQAQSLLALNKFADASVKFEHALALDPNRLTALAGAAAAAMQSGSSDAVALLRRALALKPEDPQLTTQLAEALELEGQGAGRRLLEQYVSTYPDQPQAQLTLARMRWEAGDGASFTSKLEQRLAQAPQQIALWEVLTIAYATADLHAQAADAARRAQAVVGFHPGLSLFEAVEASEAGDIGGADVAFARIPGDVPGRMLAEARHRLRTGGLDQTQRLLDQCFAVQPWDVTAWAMQGLLWRIKGNDRYHWLHGQSGLIGKYGLDLAPGELNDIAATLRELHRTRAHPLGQSLRNGTQTRGRLFERKDPTIQMLSIALEDAVRSHWRALPAYDVAHPLLRYRLSDPRIDGSWSVRLTGGGFHVAHIHPKGALSSACYLVVPEPDQPQAGYLEIGGSPPELGLGLHPAEVIEPRPGHLVLFPSTLYHATRPFAAGERLTAAFDVIADE